MFNTVLSAQLAKPQQQPQPRLYRNVFLTAGSCCGPKNWAAGRPGGRPATGFTTNSALLAGLFCHFGFWVDGPGSPQKVIHRHTYRQSNCRVLLWAEKLNWGRPGGRPAGWIWAVGSESL